VAITTQSGASSTDYTTLLGTDGVDQFIIKSASLVDIQALKANDTVTAANATDNFLVSMDSGNDQVNFAAISDSSVNGGDGNDDLNFTSTASTLTVRGGQGVDSIDFTGANKVLSALNIGGGTGNDVITLGATTDVTTSYFGGNGDADTFTFNGEVATTTIRGGKQDDVITFNDKVDKALVRGDNDDDSITVTAGATLKNTYIGGNSGNDTIDVNENAFTSTVRGGSGNDAITYDDNAATKDNEILIKGDKGNDTITIGATTDASSTVYGGVGKDEITTDANGTEGVLIYGDDAQGGDGDADTITTGAGGDSIYGGAGKDVIDAKGGNNVVTGNAGADSITTTTGNDNVRGGEGNDTIIMGAGNDSILGDEGDDTIETVAASVTEADTINGGDGTDVLSITDADGANILDTYWANFSSIETVKLADAATGNVTRSYTFASKAQSEGIKTVSGKSFDDAGATYTIDASGYTSSQAISLRASDTAGVLSKLQGGAAADALTTGKNGQTTLTGNGGADTFTLGSAESNTIADLATGDIVVVNSVANTVITANTATGFTASSATKNDGQIRMTIAVTAASKAVDLSEVTGGALGYTLTGNAGATTMTGSLRADSITGGAAVDSITGGSGDDTITGAASDDVIKLDAGADRFVFGTTDALNGTDAVTGFVLADGDNIFLNVGDGGLANLAALRGNGTDFQAIAASGALDANGGLIQATSDVADAAAMETTAEAYTGEGAGDIVYAIASTDADSTAGVVSLYKVTYAGAGDAGIEVVASLGAFKADDFTITNATQFVYA
jgi:Ca2+-binding RTX toxin-like protein